MWVYAKSRVPGICWRGVLPGCLPTRCVSRLSVCRMRRLRLALSRRGLSNGEWKLAGHGLNGGCYKGAIVMMLGSRVSADFGAFLCVLNGLLLLDKKQHSRRC